MSRALVVCVVLSAAVVTPGCAAERPDASLCAAMERYFQATGGVETWRRSWRGYGQLTADAWRADEPGTPQAYVDLMLDRMAQVEDDAIAFQLEEMCAAADGRASADDFRAATPDQAAEQGSGDLMNVILLQSELEAARTRAVLSFGSIVREDVEAEARRRGIIE